MLWREEVIMLDSIQTLLDSLPEGAVLIREGTVASANAAARRLLPQIAPGSPLPDFIPLPERGQAGCGVFAVGSQPFSFSCSGNTEEQLLLLRPAPRPTLSGRQLDGVVRQLRELLGDILVEVGPATHSPDYRVPPADFSRSFHRIFRLTDNLDYLRQAAGEGPVFQPVTMDLAGLCSHISQLAGPLLYDGGISLDYRCAEDSLLIPGDPSLLQKLLLGLISNAAKAVEQGRIILSLHRQGRRAFVTVSDSGPLPDQRHLAVLAQQDPGDGLPLPGQGAGLGLDVARHIALLHGGSLLIGLGPSAPIVTLSLPTGPLDGRISVRVPRLRRDGSLDPVLMELSDVLPVRLFGMESLD